MDDEEVSVRKAAIASLVDMQPCVSSEDQEEMVLPMLRQLLQQAQDAKLAVLLGLDTNLVTLIGQASTSS